MSTEPTIEMLVIPNPDGVQVAMSWLAVNDYEAEATTTPMGTRVVVSDGCRAFFLNATKNLKAMNPALGGMSLQGAVTPIIAQRLAEGL